MSTENRALHNAPPRNALPRNATPSADPALTKSELSQKTLKLLEFDAILERLARHSMSEESSAMIRAEKPCVDPQAVAETKNVVRAIVARMNDVGGGAGGDPRRYLPTIGFLLPSLRVEGSSLDLDEACAIGLFVERVEELRKWLNPPQPERTWTPHPALAETLDDMPDCGEVASAVFRVMDREGNIRDLPELRAIRQKIRTLKTGLDAVVSRYTANEETRRMLQSAIPSQRDGRIVLAVKANFRGRIRGIVHEVSSSGQTIFVEPEDVVERNNDILIETRNLDAEIRRILLNVTAIISGRSSDLEAFHANALNLEVFMAKARYSLETGGHLAPCAEPRCGDRPCIRLVQARHPLLANAVPIDLAMEKARGGDAEPDAGIRALIITGPNTGGKTVALKTVGLFAMMNQIGLAIPAAEGSTMPVFDGIFADIGDEQSIGQSLSTFSAHITNIAGIIAHSTERSLALLDELGSGTDPQEGSAIAMAILDHLIVKNTTLLITTHHGILKNYGYTRPEVENASMEFDTRTLSPTYRIITGIPGESRALEIAERNGLAGGIIGRARLYIDEGHSDVSALISGLKEKHRDLDSLTEKARSEEIRLRDERRKSDLKELRLRQKELELKAGFAGRLRLLLDESRKTLENLVRELREGEVTREKTLKVKEFLGELARTVEAEDAALEAEKQAIAEERRSGEARPGGGGDADTAAFMAVDLVP
ncbi:MAG: endonuclease MutS2, partial [Treponema sp.]|nr:endonuclease MutS2 [Treponema sp.]